MNVDPQRPSSPPADASKLPAAGEISGANPASDGGESPVAASRWHGPWHIKSSRIAYEDPWVTVQRDEVIRPAGGDSSYVTIYIKPGVCVVAMDDRGQVHLTEEFHYAVGRTTLEGVSGGIEPGATATETAHRELAEELGISAEQLHFLGTSDAFTANVNSPTALFVATGLTLGTPQPEATELIGHVVMPLADAVQAVIDGGITHAPTCVLLLRMALDQRFAAAAAP